MAILLKKGDKLRQEAWDAVADLTTQGFTMEYGPSGNYRIVNRETGEDYNGPLTAGLGVGKSGFFNRKGRIASEVFQDAYSRGKWGKTRAQDAEIKAGEEKLEEERIARGKALKTSSDLDSLTSERSLRDEERIETATEETEENFGGLWDWTRSDKLAAKEAEKFKSDLESYEEGWREEYDEEGVPDKFWIGKDRKVYETDASLAEQKEVTQTDDQATTATKPKEIEYFTPVKSLKENVQRGALPVSFDEGSILDKINKGASMLMPHFGIAGAQISAVQTAWNYPERYGMSWAEYLTASPEEKAKGAADIANKIRLYKEWKKQDDARKTQQ